MATFLFIMAGILFIITFGINSIIIRSDEFSRPMYASNSIVVFLIWISVFLLSFFAWSKVFDLNWILLLLINVSVVLFLGSFIAMQYLVRFTNGTGFGKDMLITFMAGIVFLIIGFIIQ